MHSSSDRREIFDLPQEIISSIASWLRFKDFFSFYISHIYLCKVLADQFERKKRLHSMVLQEVNDRLFIIFNQKLYTCSTNQSEMNNGCYPGIKKINIHHQLIKQVSIDHADLYCLTDGGELYKGSLGRLNEFQIRKMTTQTLLERIPMPENEKVRQVAVGSKRVLCLTDQGKLYAWGNNQYGQLGVGDKINRSNPTLCTGLPEDTKPLHIVLSQGSTYCLMDNGTIFSWGDNRNGRLGVGCRTNQSIAQPVAVNIPSRQIPVQIVAEKSVYCLTKDGTVYAWGKNSAGELGLGDKEDRDFPVPVLFPDRNKCRHIVRNLMGVLCLMEDGSLYVWGSNGYGQLGLEGVTSCNTPTQVFLNQKKAIQVTACNGSVFVMTAEGELYVWGLNNYGQLGLGNTIDYKQPQPLKLPDNALPIKIAIDPFGKNVYCLAENGLLYKWGKNCSKPLGVGDTCSQNSSPCISSFRLEQCLTSYKFISNNKTIFSRLKIEQEDETEVGDKKLKWFCGSS